MGAWANTLGTGTTSQGDDRPRHDERSDSSEPRAALVRLTDIMGGVARTDQVFTKDSKDSEGAVTSR
jgi:hypothetical protein